MDGLERAESRAGWAESGAGIGAERKKICTVSNFHRFFVLC